MLENLKAKVEGEGAKEQEIHDKYMCYCKNGASSLEKSIADAGPKTSQLASDIEAAEAKKTGLDGEIANHKADQVGAKKAMAEATALRAKEQEEFDAAVAEEEAELGPIHQDLDYFGVGPNSNNTAAGNATAAAAEAPVESEASFLQSSGAKVLRKLVQAKENMLEGDRNELLSFLSNDEFSPANGEIIGILKGMEEEVVAKIADLKKQEEDGIKSYDEVMAATNRELEPIQAMIEEKMMRAGEIPVAIVEMKNDLGDTGEQIAEDKKFLADLGKNCETKQKFFEENVRMRGQEIQALADTIKVLNDDDALELFKKA